MIHELIEQKKKSQRGSTSRNTKAFHDPKAASQTFHDPKGATFEVSDGENKEAESSSTVFIPPWLKNSLGLNQRNNLNLDWSLCLPNFTALGPAGGSSESKSSKILQKGKGISQNEFDSSKGNIERERCKKTAAKFDILQKDEFQDVCLNQVEDAEERQNVSVKMLPVYWDLRAKKSESGSSCTNLENQYLKKDSQTAGGEVFSSAGTEKIKIEDKKRLKFFRPKGRIRKHVVTDSKQPEPGKNGIDLFLEIKAREVLDNCARGSVGSASPETKHREPKLLFPGSKPHSPNCELNREEFRMLRELKHQVGGVEDLEKVFEHVRDSNFRESVKTPESLAKNPAETSEKEVKFAKGLTRKYVHDGNSKPDKDSLLSTDDENDIKRFSEFLSKNKNLDEKRKCLEEVRNYFERKRRTRLTKHNFLGDEKPSPRTDRKEEQIKEKTDFRESHRGRRCALALSEEAVEKAVDETLQKFVELYHFRVSPSSLENMKKTILQAIKADIMAGGGSSKLNEVQISPLNTKKANFEQPMKELEITGGPVIIGDRDPMESPKKEPKPYREGKKKNFRTLVDSFGDQVSKPPREGESLDSEKLRRLRKDFDNFLHSVQGRMDLSNLKLQSLILEKEERTSSAKGVQFAYSFEKKVLEPVMAELISSYFERMEMTTQKDCQIQTIPEPEVGRKNVKIQTHEPRICCEQSLQTEDKDLCTRDTQTEGKGVTVREINELKSHEVSAGLYRMVRSKDAGKFYLYPEEGGKQEGSGPSKCYITRGKKFKRTEFFSIVPRERRFFPKEREKIRLKKVRGTVPYKNLSLKSAKKKKLTGTSEDSINCLYFRNLGKKGSESLSSKKELTDENVKDQFDSEERMEDVKEDHLGCFWFWNGEKISPGCDLKTHVENIVKEKLTEMTNFDGQQNDFLANAFSLKNYPEQTIMNDAPQRTLDGRPMNSLFCYNSPKSFGKEMGMELAFEECANQEDRRKMEVKRKESDEIGGPLMSIPLEKPVKNVATQDSQSLPLAASLIKQSGPRLKSTFKRKCTRRNIIIKPAPGGRMTLKKAEAIIRAVEEIKKLKLGLENPNNDSLTEIEFMMEGSTSTLCSNKNAVLDPESRAMGIPGSPGMERLSNEGFKSKTDKLIGLVDREVQTTDAYDCEDSNSVDNEATEQTEDGQKHFELIENVLGRVNQKERENLWNDLRDFIKTKIGRDINDEGAREVCIEIEQDLPKGDQGNVKQSVVASGHHDKNEGDVEVEIDLTMEDLAKILRQRQRKIQRRNLSRNSKSRTFLSSSSVQSDITREEIRRYQKYLQKFAAADGSFVQGKEIRGHLRNKGN